MPLMRASLSLPRRSLAASASSSAERSSTCGAQAAGQRAQGAHRSGVEGAHATRCDATASKLWLCVSQAIRCVICAWKNSTQLPMGR